MKSCQSPLLIGILTTGLAMAESFEAPKYQPGQFLEEESDWKAISLEGATPSAPVISNEQSAFGGQSLKVMPGGGVIHPVASSTLRFVDFYILPTFSEEAGVQLKVAGAQLGFVQNGTTGEVFVVNSTTGDAEVIASYPIGDGRLAEAWARFTLRIDRVSKQWDLYLDGKPVRANLPLDGADMSFELKGAYEGETYLDGFVEEAENPLFADHDRDGLPDAMEKAYGLNAYADDRQGDLDRDGISNATEFFSGSSLQASGSVALNEFLFVDNLSGNDANSGKMSYPAVGGDGPKASLKAAMAAAKSGGVIVVLKGRGIYKEGSRSAEGKRLIIKPVEPVTIE